MSNIIPDIEEIYISGDAIRTDIGDCYFIKVNEYWKYLELLGVLTLDKNRIIAGIYNQDKKGEYTDYIELAKELSLYEIVASIEQYVEIYQELFSRLFRDKSVWGRVNKDNFDYFRELVMKMNGIPEEETSPNPEIQQWIDREKRFKQEGGNINFTDIVSSVVVGTGASYQQVNDYTLFQLYMTFKRITQFKAYDTSTLFSTVASDSVDIESWAKNIPVVDREKLGISKDEFDKTFANMFG